MISTDFQSILVTEDNKEQNSEEGYTDIKNILLSVMAIN